MIVIPSGSFGPVLIDLLDSVFTVPKMFQMNMAMFALTLGTGNVIRAMASLGDGPVQRAEVARVLAVTSEILSVPRARLLDKGFIQAESRGKLEFTISGFAAFVRDLEE